MRVTRVGRAQVGQHGAAGRITGILHREGPAIRRANGPVHVSPGFSGGFLVTALLSKDYSLTGSKNVRSRPLSSLLVRT